MRVVDLFSGIGSVHLACRSVHGASVVLASEKDPDAAAVYRRNFGMESLGDVNELEQLPDHDVIFAGFPCQSFSKLGTGGGFDHPILGGFFRKVLDLATTNRTRCVVMENVRQFMSLEERRDVVSHAFGEAGYHVAHRFLNALDFGLPQMRERVFLVAFRTEDDLGRFEWPDPRALTTTTLEDLLEPDEAVDPKVWASERVVRDVRTLAHENSQATAEYQGKRSIWALNRSNRVTVRPYARTLRAKPSFNYMLVDGMRRPTEREMARLQGFPDEFVFDHVKSYKTMQRLFGNTIPLPFTKGILQSVARVVAAV